MWTLIGIIKFLPNNNKYVLDPTNGKSKGHAYVNHYAHVFIFLFNGIRPSPVT